MVPLLCVTVCWRSFNIPVQKMNNDQINFILVCRKYWQQWFTIHNQSIFFNNELLISDRWRQEWAYRFKATCFKEYQGKPSPAHYRRRSSITKGKVVFTSDGFYLWDVVQTFKKHPEKRDQHNTQHFRKGKCSQSVKTSKS